MYPVFKQCCYCFVLRLKNCTNYAKVASVKGLGGLGSNFYYVSFNWIWKLALGYFLKIQKCFVHCQDMMSRSGDLPTRCFPGVFMNKQRRGFEKKVHKARQNKFLVFLSPHASLFGRASGKFLSFSYTLLITKSCISQQVFSFKVLSGPNITIFSLCDSKIYQLSTSKL